MRRRASLVVLIALITGACGPGDLDLVLGEGATEDLTASPEPGVRAAGESAVEILSAREAERNLDVALTEGDLDAIARARNLRSDDPRYTAYEAALYTGQGDAQGPRREAIVETARRITTQDPDITPQARARVGEEMYLTALRDVLLARPEYEGRARALSTYCYGINDFYPQYFTGEFPQEVSLYLALEADFGLCT
jgi:hypothetical protein